MTTIQSVQGYEILDSRGRPTVLARCELESGIVVSASVPSGASTGRAEALELRDGDPQRYRGLGCRRAAANVSGPINAALAGRAFASQEELDRRLIDLDGTPNKSGLGANAILAVSVAFARAAAAERRIPLYLYFAEMLGQNGLQLPRPMINLFSGGKHAGGQVAIQDVLVVPVAAVSMDQALATTYSVYQAAADLILDRYGMRALTADEGGLAPAFDDPEAMLDMAVRAIRQAGFEPGTEVALAVDVAASHFYQRGAYHIGDVALEPHAMIDRVARWVADYPLVAVEDGLAEDDWDNWPRLAGAIGAQARVIGDDLLCTNPSRIERAIESAAANTLLLKVNQIGTLTEAAEACRLAQTAGWQVVASARSGETEDNWLADIAIGWGANTIKVGSITQSERLAKYNRLLLLEAEVGLSLRNDFRLPSAG